MIKQDMNMETILLKVQNDWLKTFKSLCALYSIHARFHESGFGWLITRNYLFNMM